MTDAKEAPKSMCKDLTQDTVRDIDIEELEEYKALEVLGAMMCQLTRSVTKVHAVTNEGTLVIFNAPKFLRGLKRVQNYVEREFPPKDQETP